MGAAHLERAPFTRRIAWEVELPDNEYIGLMSMRVTWGPGLLSMRVTWGPGLVSMRVAWGPGVVGPISVWHQGKSDGDMR